jgi:hypothetical protein
MSATNSQDLRELIQGPGDVEWRYVVPLFFQTSRERRSSAGMTCGINVRRSFLAFYSVLSKSPRI